jgi:hypothetical protein
VVIRNLRLAFVSLDDVYRIRLIADASQPPISTIKWQAMWSLIVHLQPARAATLEGDPPRAILLESFGETEVAPGLLAHLEQLAMTGLRVEVAD